MRHLVNDIMARFGPLPRATQNAGTVITVPVPPWVGPLGNAPFLYKFDNGIPNWPQFAGRTVISSALYTTAATAHTVTLMRPLNFARITAAIAANGTAISIDKDPGVYSTNYRYPTPGGTVAAGTGAVPAAADNALAAGDFVGMQLSDGRWHFSTIASGTFGGGNIVLTTAVPNVTGVTVLINSPMFWFGAVGDVNPATGLAHSATLTIANATRANLFDDDVIGWGNSLNPGDPMILHSDNGTNAGSFEGAAGYFSKL